MGVCDDSVSPSRSIILVFGGLFFFRLGKKIVVRFEYFIHFFDAYVTGVYTGEEKGFR